MHACSCTLIISLDMMSEHWHAGVPPVKKSTAAMRQLRAASSRAVVSQPGVTSEVCEDDGRLHVVVHVGAWGAILAAKPHPCQGQGGNREFRDPFKHEEQREALANSIYRGIRTRMTVAVQRGIAVQKALVAGTPFRVHAGCRDTRHRCTAALGHRPVSTCVAAAAPGRARHRWIHCIHTGSPGWARDGTPAAVRGEAAWQHTQ